MSFLNLDWKPVPGALTYSVRFRPTPTGTTVPPPPPAVLESPNGATITATTDPAIIDASLKSWTLVPSNNGGLQVNVNGAAAGYSANVVLLLYYVHVIYQSNSDGGWWYWNGDWVATTDPRQTIPTPPPTEQVQTYVTGLTRPWAMAQLPDKTFLVTQRDAFKLTHITADGVHHDMSVSGAVTTNGDGGLMGVCADVSYSTNHYIYLTYTTASGNRLYRYVFDQVNHTLTGATILATWASATYGNGGVCKVGPDGKVYACCGYAGSATNPQSLSNYNGKIIRVNPDGSVPADNPFAGSLIWTFGHRVPSGLCWMGTTCFATEIGPNGENINGVPTYGYDKLNVITAGSNYGYPLVAGTNTTIDARGNRTTAPALTSGNTEIWTPGGIAAIGQTLLWGALAGLAG